VSVAATASGTAYQLICHCLAALPEFQLFRAGGLSREEFQGVIDQCRADDWGLNEDQLNLATRLPVDEATAVAEFTRTLVADLALPAAHYSAEEFGRWRASVESHFDHGPNLTYIFPEEAHLLFVLAQLRQPRSAVFLGSYYGYWAIWAMPAIAAAGGTAVLIDPDPKVLELSWANLQKFGYADRCRFICEDAAAYLDREPHQYDLAVLDAEGPPASGPPEYRGKAIYHPLTVSVTPRLRPHGLLVAHNILLANLSENAYFKRKIEKNNHQFAEFLPYLDLHYDVQRQFPTTEGVGVFRRAAGIESGDARRRRSA
jgi:predicted O-methyltransferase YrrM